MQYILGLIIGLIVGIICFSLWKKEYGKYLPDNESRLWILNRDPCYCRVNYFKKAVSEMEAALSIKVQFYKVF